MLNRFLNLFNVSRWQVAELFRPRTDEEALAKTLLVLSGIFLSPFALLGAIVFYKKAYNRFMADERPRLHHLPPIARFAMIVGGALIWGLVIVGFRIVLRYLDPEDRMPPEHKGFVLLGFLVSVGIWSYITALIWGRFEKWRNGMTRYIDECERHGTARFANYDELLPYAKPEGFYIGAGIYYNKPGHFTSTAGTRGGKGVNIILQNLLMPHLAPSMSWVVIDPKGELAAISANAQRKAGRKVVILNPWQLLGLHGISYNPLDILKHDKLHLADDVQMLAEAIVPSDSGEKESHWPNRARTFISGLLLHLVTSRAVEERHLGTLWQWLRLDHDSWVSLLAEMTMNNDANAGEIIQATANEIISLMKNSQEEYGSVMSCAQEHTDFIKSLALRDSMKSSDEFTAADLASGNVTVYVSLPLDKLKSHKGWTRLIVTSLMRSVIRNPQKDVCFLIDEAYAFGHHSEVDMALGAYAGLGIHIWSIFQTLPQIKATYGDNWENFIANSSVRHFFNISDNFSAEYLEKMFGQTSVPQYNEKGEVTGATGRPLVTMDEIRRASGDVIYTVIDQLAPAEIPKLPYYEMNLPADPNPYYKAENKK